MKNAAQDSTEWKKLCLLGAEKVALKIKGRIQLQKCRLKLWRQRMKIQGLWYLGRRRDEFWVEPTQFQYIRGYGKPKHLFKEFEHLRRQFWKQQEERESHEKSKEEHERVFQWPITITEKKKMDDAEAGRSLIKGQKKHVGAVRKKKERKKAIQASNWNQAKTPPSPPSETETEQ